MTCYNPVITQTEITVFLGRPLSKQEKESFNTYLEIADLRLKDLLCLEEWPNPLPADLKMLIAKVFGAIKATQDFERENGVTAKKVEDFSVNYSADRKNPLTLVLSNENATLLKYSNCSSGIMHGETIL